MSRPINYTPTQCKICDRTFKTTRGLSNHIIKTHKTKIQDYFDTYVDLTPHTCLGCGSQTTFQTMTEGYSRFCSMMCNNKDPELAKQRTIARLNTYKKDPTIMEKLLIKRAKTLKTSFNQSIGLRNYYRDLYKKSSTMPCCLYVVSHSSLDIVKIGITINIAERMSNLKKHFGPITIIKTIETTHDLASALEDELHKYFKEHCKVQPSGSGRTEWFDASITEEALQILQETIP